MTNFKNISTRDLLNEIKNREETRTVEVKSDEFHRVQAMKSDESRNRYIKGRGPALILEINLKNSRIYSNGRDI